MRKNSVFKLFLVAIFCVLFAVAAISCLQNNVNDDSETEIDSSVKSISIEEKGVYYLNDADIDLSEVKILVTYADKRTTTVSLTDEMISDEDRRKFQEVGTYSIKVTYQGAVCYYQFEIKKQTQEETHLASFSPMNGKELQPIAASVIEAFPLPERKGYTFDGWFTAIERDESTGKIRYLGAKVAEPYQLKEDTVFYAKWIDNREYDVTFYDGYQALLSVKVHHGESIDISSYDFMGEIGEGRKFVNWNVLNGDPKSVEANLTVRANFSIDKCFIFIEYANSSGEIETVEKDFDYGTEIEVGGNTNYVLPKKVGYIPRFVVYYDHAEDYEDEYDEILYEELGESNSVVLTHAYTTIKPIFTIEKYNITIWNGDENQAEQNLRSGEIALIQTYQVEKTKTPFSVEWNQGFDFSEHTQDPDISSPTAIKDENNVEGYKGEWAFVVPATQTAPEKLFNPSGLVWNKEKQIYEDRFWNEQTQEYEELQREEGESDNDWILRDNDGNYIARVYNKKLTEIKANVTIKAIYTKRTFDVTLVRKDSGQQITLVTFKVKYMSDVNIYDSDMYPNEPTVDGAATTLFPAHFVTGYTINDAALKEKADRLYDPHDELTQIEKLYLKENTDLSVKKNANGYYMTNSITNDNNLEEDWTVEWFTDPSWETGKIDFSDPETTITVRNKVTLYCKDTDRRKYEVKFFYKYNFGNQSYDYSDVTPNANQEFYTENEVVSPPITTEQITRIAPNSTVSVAYSFSGWYETPYALYLSTGYRGKELTDFTRRTSKVYYYAHYECNKQVTVSIYDKTQSTAFVGQAGTTAKGFLFEDCSVADDTIRYTMPIGTKFDMSILYKGKSFGNGRTIPGQTYYDNYKKKTFYEDYYESADENSLRMYLIGEFGGENEAERIATMTQIYDVLIAFLNDYKSAVESVYTHNYSNYTIGDGSEYEYYLKIFNDPQLSNEFGFTDFVTEYNELATRGVNVTQRLIAAGYTSDLFASVGDLNDFIDYYVKLLYRLYTNGYEPKHTGLSGIGMNNINDFVSQKSKYSTCRKIQTVCSILQEYIGFLQDFGEFDKDELDLMPTYEDSYNDLNQAYNFSGVGDDVKYRFSGWYDKSDYTGQISKDFIFEAFYLENDRVMYAKWTDITKGPEGLVYEEVKVKTGAGENDWISAYVLVDFTNKSEYNAAGVYADNEYYYVTTNDKGDIPTNLLEGGITSIDMQIPVTIDKYLDKSALAAEYYAQGIWSGESGKYKQFFVSDGKTYVQASSNYSSEITYYQKTQYNVIGIKTGAFDRYSQYITSITVPVNMTFVEEGAFRYCNTKSYNKAGESEDQYIVIDENGYALYQNIAAPYLSVEGKSSYYLYSFDHAKTLTGFVVDLDTVQTYTLAAGTRKVGDYTFYNAIYLEKIMGTSDLTEIGDRAFYGAKELISFGVEGKISIGTNVTKIGKECFAYCEKLATLEVEAGSRLAVVGKDAFLRTKWYDSSAHKGVIVLRFVDADSLDTGIVLGYYSASEATDYDHNVLYDLNGVVYTGAVGQNEEDFIYYGMPSDGTLILSKGGTVYNVIFDFAVKYICENAFNNMKASRFTFVSVGEVADGAFSGNPQLYDITIEEAFKGEATILGKNLFSGRGLEPALCVTFPSEAVKTAVTNDDSWNDYTVISAQVAP